MNTEQVRVALRQAKQQKMESRQGTGMLKALAKEYYVEIRELRTPPVVMPWNQIAEIVMKNSKVRMSSAGLSRAFAAIEVEECKKHDLEPLPGPRAHLKKRDRRRKNADRK